MREALGALGLAGGSGSIGPVARACHEGRLEGGLSVALAVTPDELFGPLVLRLGAAARGVRVLDVRSTEPMRLLIRWGAACLEWEVAGLEDLVEHFNEQFAAENEVPAIAVLGEWEEMLQLWCVPKPLLSSVLRTGALAEARNLPWLRRMVRTQRSAMSR